VECVSSVRVSPEQFFFTTILIIGLLILATRQVGLAPGVLLYVKCVVPPVSTEVKCVDSFDAYVIYYCNNDTPAHY
jgi:hypothetical protein